MILHVFNPEHDMALAANDSHFTAPHAGRAMRADLGFMPALWADDGDVVLVDNAEQACEKARHFRRLAANVRYAELGDLSAHAEQVSGVDVWGWDPLIRSQLAKAGVSGRLLPSDDDLMRIREVSSREWAALHLLPKLRLDNTVGEAFSAGSVADVEQFFHRFSAVCLKAPWSCSGRGVRFVSADNWDDRVRQWSANVISRQGLLMVEPLYNKVKDFGMEFVVSGKSVNFAGLSLFKTINGAYAGSIIATERAKRDLLRPYISEQRLQEVAHIIEQTLQGVLPDFYQGPLGVDMMIVADVSNGSFLLHPCVELNLRRTMGHVALSVGSTEMEPQRLLRVEYLSGYHLRLLATNENVEDRDIF